MTSSRHRLGNIGLAIAAASSLVGAGGALPAMAEDTVPAFDCSAGQGLVLFSYWKFVAEHPECAPAMSDDANYESLLYGTGGDGPGNKWVCVQDRYSSNRGCSK